MRTLATVVALHEGGIATVQVERHAACDGCHRATDGKGCSVCSLLGGERIATAKAKNTVGAALGERVEITTATRRVLGYAALLFLIPVLFLLTGYFVTDAVWGSDLAPLGAMLLFLLSFLPIFLYSRFVVARRVDVEIVAVCQREEKEN